MNYLKCSSVQYSYQLDTKFLHLITAHYCFQIKGFHVCISGQCHICFLVYLHTKEATCTASSQGVSVKRRGVVQAQPKPLMKEFSHPIFNQIDQKVKRTNLNAAGIECLFFFFSYLEFQNYIYNLLKKN